MSRFQDDSALLEQELEQELKSVQEKCSEAERTVAKLRSEMEHTKVIATDLLDQYVGTIDSIRTVYCRANRIQWVWRCRSCR